MAGSDFYSSGTTVIGADPPLRYNSAKYKAQGVTKPSDLYTLAVFRDLQTQVNRLAGVKGLPHSTQLVADGDLGPKTVALMVKLGLVPAGTTSAKVAAQADVLALKARNLSDNLAAPRVETPSPVKPPVLVDAGGKATQVPVAAVPASPAEAPVLPPPRPIEVAVAPTPTVPAVKVMPPTQTTVERPPLVPTPVAHIQVEPTVAEVTRPSTPAPASEKQGGSALPAIGLGLAGLLGLVFVAKKKKGR